MKNMRKHIQNFLKDESGQGTTEYILILVAVVAIAWAFGPQIKRIVGEKITDVSGRIQGFNP